MDKIRTIMDFGNKTRVDMLTLAEITERKKELSAMASECLKHNDVDHIIYYYDTRDYLNHIVECHMYYALIGLNDDTFYDRTSQIPGMIGAVHKIK